MYVIHVDWNWIRQRPHALAQALDSFDDSDVLVAYLPKWRRSMLAKNPSSIRRVAVPQLPFARFGPVKAMNAILARAFLSLMAMAWRQDITMVAYPTLFRVLPQRLRRGILVYDCMDVARGFARSGPELEEIELAEDSLVAAADLVLASSAHIGDLLRSRRIVPTRLVVVRNGYDGDFVPLPRARRGPIVGPLRIGYFGTISHWVDLDVLGAALAHDTELEFHLWGPADRALPVHPRIHHHGPVNHGRLRDEVSTMDALVMPFRVGELIRGVDPVKLYEYVALGRPILSVYYPELEQFRGLVHFYATEAEFIEFTVMLRADPERLSPPAPAAAEFLQGATWRARARVARDAMTNVERSATP